MADLITVPTFTFKQGDPFEGGEYPIQVLYWNDDMVELNQKGNEVLIRAEYLRKLVKEIERHLPEAKKKLSK